MSNIVTVETSLGSFQIELDVEHAPKSVENFLSYVDANHYAGTIFHRVIPTFMIQGGGYDASYDKKPTNPPIENEAGNGLKNLRGTVAMARTGDPHSATCQFFVNVVDSDFLNHRAPSGSDWGYAVFGKVTSGMDAVDKIKDVATGSNGPFAKDAPNELVTIVSIRRA